MRTRSGLATTTATNDEDNVGSTAMATVPITSSTITPPFVTDISHSSLVKWKRLRHEYEEAVKARCITSGEDADKAMLSVKNSFDSHLLEMLCKYDWDTTVEQVPEQRIINEINKIVNNVKNGDIRNVDLLFETKLKMNLRESDVQARVMNYFKLCEEIILEHGLKSTFSTPMGIAHKCKILKKHLQPSALRDEIETHQKLIDKSSTKSDVVLYKLVKEKALEQDKVFRSMSNLKQQQQQRQQTGHAAGKPTGKREKEAKKPVKTGQRSNDRYGKDAKRQVEQLPPDKSSAAPRSKSSGPRGGCFHCGKEHFLSDCPEIDEAQKEAILAERAPRKKAPKKQRLKRVNLRARGADRVRATATINGTLDLPYCADSGSEYNIISQELVEKLRAVDNGVELVELIEHVELEAVGGAILTATHAVDVRLTLNTAAGPVRCQDHKRCLIVESDDDELIVGRILLAELGIDVDRELEQLATRSSSDDDHFGDPNGIPSRGVTQDADIAAAIEAMVTDAAIREMVDGAGAVRLRRILMSFSGWRLVLGDDPPARVPPLKIKLKPNARPYRCKVRQYSPDKSEFLASFNAELVKLGWVYENKASRWACAALPVRKPNSSEYRQTNDYRPVNSMTEGIAGVMPSLQVRLERCRGKKFYAVFDFLKGFWQLPLAKASQEILSYMTDRGVFTPTRVPQGSTDAALHFQSTVEDVLKDHLHDNLLVWIDDLLAYADSATELLDVIEAILTKLDEFGFKLNPKKCKLFLTEVKWCGRIINEHGVGHDPKRIESLRAIPEPTTAAELQQFTCATNWMRDGLVDYARVSKPLQELLERSLRDTKRSKRAAAGINITLSQEERASFTAVKELLSNSAMLTYPDHEKQLCLFSDASDSGWGLIVTQVAHWSQNSPIHEHEHELLICMGA